VLAGHEYNRDSAVVKAITNATAAAPGVDTLVLPVLLVVRIAQGVQGSVLFS